MRHYTINGLTRISKTRARVLYSAGSPVIACPCNLRPGAPWHPEAILSPDTGDTFDQRVNAASYYNCNRDSGRYLAYYVAEGVLPL